MKVFANGEVYVRIYTNSHLRLCLPVITTTHILVFRANKILFASDVYDPHFPTMPIAIEKGRDHLTAKTMVGVLLYVTL